MISIINVVGQLTSYKEDSNSDKTMEIEDGSKSETIASIILAVQGYNGFHIKYQNFCYYYLENWR